MKIELRNIKEKGYRYREWTADLYVDGKFSAEVTRYAIETRDEGVMFRLRVFFKESLLSDTPRKLFEYINKKHGPIHGTFDMERLMLEEMELVLAEKEDRAFALKHLKSKYPDVPFKMRWEKGAYCLIWEGGPSLEAVMKEADRGIYCGNFLESLYDEKYPDEKLFTKEWNFKFIRKERHNSL